MKTSIEFLKGFSKKMLTLALLTGIIIALTMPITYFLLTWAAQEDQAENNSFKSNGPYGEHTSH